MTRTAPLIAGILLLHACADAPTTTPAADLQPPVARQAAPTAELQDLAELRRATAPFHREAAAREANYTLVFLDQCMVDGSAEALGGMGYHLVNTTLLDGQVEVGAPEALMYEPDASGRWRLVGVEYVIPKDAWTGSGKPVLFGREFKLNAFDLWALHVWVWKDNPAGMYKDWNPRVTCEHAAPAPASAHH